MDKLKFLFFGLTLVFMSASGEEDYYNKGNEAFTEGRYDDAIKYYTSYIQKNPKIPDPYYSRGLAHYKKEEYELAIKDYTNAIQLSPDIAAPYFVRGIAYSEKGEYELAIKDYNKAIELRPNYAFAYYNRGRVYYEKGDYDLAVKDYTKAIELKVDYDVAYYNRGRAYYEKGDYDLAIEDYNKVIELKPDYDSYTSRGMVYSEKGEYELAIKDYNKAIELRTDYAPAYENRGRTYHEKGDYDLAIKDCNKAIELRTDYAPAYYNRGRTNYEKGDYDLAIKDYTKAIELRTDYDMAYYNRGRIYYEKGDYNLAIEDYNKAIELKPDYDSYTSRGMVYSEKGEYELAIKDYNKAIELKPDSAMTYYNRGHIYYKKGNYDLAVNDYNKAIELKPDYAPAYSNRGLAHYVKAKYDLAIMDYTKAIELRPDYTTYTNRGWVYNIIGEYDLAVNDYNKAIELKVDYTTYTNRGWVYNIMNEYDLAIADYNKSIELKSDYAPAYYNRGRAYYGKEEYDFAIRDFSKSIELNPDYIAAYNKRAQANFKINDCFNLVRDCEMGLSKLAHKPDDKYNYVFLGLKYLCMKDDEKAVEYFTKGIERYPEFGDLYALRGDVYYRLDKKELATEDLSMANECLPEIPSFLYAREIASADKITYKEPSKPITKPPKPAVTTTPKTIITAPPKLTFDYSLFDENDDRTLEGGEKISLKINVENLGEGTAHGVKVLISGNNQIVKYFGEEKYLGLIPAGSEKEAVFETVLPYTVEAEDANIIIKVLEQRGFNALKEEEFIVAVQPAKIKRDKKVISTIVDIDQPLISTSLKREDAYAVIIGISNYRSEVIPEVKYARRDVETMKEYLVNVCGIPAENIISLVDDRAALSDLTAYIEEWLARNVSENSFVFIYFAGHGTPNPEKGDAYLVPYDGEPGFISKLYPLSRLYNSLERLPSNQIVVALDACFSGSGGRSVIEKGKRPLTIVKMPENLGKVTAITASAADEISQDLDTKRHGLFTYYLLKGLRGEADTNDDSWITLGELYNYCKPKISEESRRLGYTQTVQVSPSPLGEKADLRIGKVK